MDPHLEHLEQATPSLDGDKPVTQRQQSLETGEDEIDERNLDEPSVPFDESSPVRTGIGFRQLRAMLWTSWLLKKRQWVVAISEIVVPLLLIGLIIIGYFLANVSNMGAEIYTDEPLPLIDFAGKLATNFLDRGQVQPTGQKCAVETYGGACINFETELVYLPYGNLSLSEYLAYPGMFVDSPSANMSELLSSPAAMDFISLFNMSTSPPTFQPGKSSQNVIDLFVNRTSDRFSSNNGLLNSSVITNNLDVTNLLATAVDAIEAMSVVNKTVLVHVTCIPISTSFCVDVHANMDLTNFDSSVLLPPGVDSLATILMSLYAYNGMLPVVR